MKKFLILLPILIGGVMLTGCETQVVVTPPAPRPVPVYYGDPYYVYGGVQYYYVGGRYYYWHNNNRVYIRTLPVGGRYYHRRRY